jgi:menaquinone-dependent protoporphyrinogen IX oxidase
MNGHVIFTSKYGATKQYAEWIGQHFNIPVHSTELLKNDVPVGDYYILGSPVYMGKVIISSWLKAHESFFRNKKVFLFVVGGTRPEEKEAVSRIMSDNFPHDNSIKIETFYLRGRCTKSLLGFKDRLLLSIGAALAGSKEKRMEMLSDFNDVNKFNMDNLLLKVESFLKDIYSKESPASATIY